jgi:hypothetical protein
MRPSILRPLALAAMLSLTACQASPTTPVAAVGARQDGVLLQGRVTYPGYGLLAVESDMTRQSAIALIDATGVTRAAGTTDASGIFTLYRSTATFTPQTGDVFTLEAMRRQDVGTGQRWLTLRTLVRRTATGWTSLSGPAVTLSLNSTALYTILANEPALRAAAWGSIALTTPGDLPGYPASAIQAMGTQLAAQLAAGDDPSGGLIYEGDVTIRTQADVAALKPYSRIRGALVIESDDLTSFSLPFLRVVDDYVHVESRSLTSLSGLSSLVACGGLMLEACDALTDLTGLDRLADTDGLQLQGCSNLTSLNGLTALTSLNHLIITQCHKLTSLAGLERLTRVGNIGLQSNGLTSLTGLNGVTTAHDITLMYNRQLVDLSGLDALTTVHDLTVEVNDALQSTQGLGALTTVNGSVSIRDNPQLASLDGLSALTTVTGGLDFSRLPVTTLSPLANLERVGSLYLFELPAVTSTAAFGKLTALSMLMIDGCPGLTDLSGFSSLTSVTVLSLGGELCNATLPLNLPVGMKGPGSN